MATKIFGKKVSFEIVSPYSDDFIGSVNTLRNEAKKITRQECRLQKLIKLLRQLEKGKRGKLIKPHKLNINFKDLSDLKFYEVVMEKKDKNAKLVTGNIKDFPSDRRIVTPREMLKLIEK